jgi:lipoate synthase
LVLTAAKEVNPDIITKSSIMLGLGETDEQVHQTLRGKHAKFLYILSYSSGADFNALPASYQNHARSSFSMVKLGVP